MEKQAIIDENCFVIPPLPGPREDAPFSGKPFISGMTPTPTPRRMFDSKTSGGTTCTRREFTYAAISDTEPG